MIPRDTLQQSTEPLSVTPAALALNYEFTISAQQRALMRALDERDSSLKVMYQGAITVLLVTSNPDRFAQCSHSIRELMEKIPELLDVPIVAMKESLKNKVNEIEAVYKGTRKKTTCFSAPQGGWDGNIDAPLRQFLSRLGDFFEWFASHHPRRRDELQSILVELDGSSRGLPKPLALLNVKFWEEHRDYFQSVAHHRRDAVEEEFLQWLGSLELFLLDKLKPRTFDDFDEIDTILEEVGENAKS
jgi:hypothetical protein